MKGEKLKTKPMETLTLKQRLDLFRLFANKPFDLLLRQVDDLLLRKISGKERHDNFTFWACGEDHEKALKVILFYLSSSEAQRSEFREAFSAVLLSAERQLLSAPHLLGLKAQIANAKVLFGVVTENTLGLTVSTEPLVVQTGLPVNEKAACSTREDHLRSCVDRLKGKEGRC